MAVAIHTDELIPRQRVVGAEHSAGIPTSLEVDSLTVGAGLVLVEALSFFGRICDRVAVALEELGGDAGIDWFQVHAEG